MSEKFHLKPTFSKATFHAIALCNHLSVTLYLSFLDPEAHNEPVLVQLTKYSLRVYTTWNYTFQGIFLASACVADWVDLYKPDAIWRRALRTHSDSFFMSIVVPSTGLTSYLFWVLYGIDRNLVYPKECDLMVPTYVNHSLHTLVAFVVLIELAMGPRKLRVLTSKQFLGAITVMVVAFYSTLFYTRIVNGIWLYSFYAHLNWYQMTGFIVIACWSPLYIFEKVGWRINELHSETFCTTLNKPNGDVQGLDKHVMSNAKFS